MQRNLVRLRVRDDAIYLSRGDTVLAVDRDGFLDGDLPSERLRGPKFFDPQRIDDPLMATHQALENRLGNRFTLLRAVSFASPRE